MNVKKFTDKYSDGFFRFMYGNQAISDGESRKRGEAFLERYALSKEQYAGLCVPAMEKVFRIKPTDRFSIGRDSVAGLFQDGFLLYAYYASPLFSESDYILLQNVARHFGDDSFYIVESEICEEDTETALKIRIPADLQWQELEGAGFVEDILTHMPNNRYLLFGDNACWGKWCDYDNPWNDYEVFAYTEECQAVREYQRMFESNKMDKQ